MQDARDRFSPPHSDGRPRGPLGDVVALQADPRDAWFLRRMRLHDLGGLLWERPEVLWSDPQPGWRDMGVLAHLREDRSGGPLDFQEVLVILNPYELGAEGEALEDWLWETEQMLEAAIAEEARTGALTLRSDPHPVRVSVVIDGDPHRMKGASFGLVGGEYVTALLPNLRSHTSDARPRHALRLELRALEEGGVREAELTEDQAELTFGTHWLDNVHHPALPGPATLILTQHTSGVVSAQLNPDLQGRCTLVSHGGAGAQVHLLKEGERTLARLVVKRLGGASPQAQRAASAPAPRVRVAGVQPWRPRSALLATPAPSDALALRQVGALVQRARHAHRMEGHALFVRQDGALRPDASHPLARIEVRHPGEGEGVQLIPMEPGLTRDGEPLTAPLPLTGRVALHAKGRPLIYEDLREISEPAWPYVGQLRAPAGPPKRAKAGQRHSVGRARSAWLRLPDSPVDDNILWRADSRPGSSEDSLRGVALRTDAMGVAEEHAVLDLTGDVAVLEALSPRAPCYVRRRLELHALVPDGPKQPARLALCVGDELLIGGALLKVVTVKGS